MTDVRIFQLRKNMKIPPARFFFRGKRDAARAVGIGREARAETAQRGAENSLDGAFKNTYREKYSRGNKLTSSTKNRSRRTLYFWASRRGEPSHRTYSSCGYVIGRSLKTIPKVRSDKLFVLPRVRVAKLLGQSPWWSPIFPPLILSEATIVSWQR